MSRCMMLLARDLLAHTYDCLSVQSMTQKAALSVGGAGPLRLNVARPSHPERVICRTHVMRMSDARRSVARTPTAAPSYRSVLYLAAPSMIASAALIDVVAAAT
ncbi:hypothetical protein BD309DRAFT_55095 [Dichomitus squalens]|nr:hypothetical protein BD309DRAFT_55095 [Dichomitus squalens]